MTPVVHATAVARSGALGWRGALLRGPSGAGKSDLALRLVDKGWRLVADDYTHVWASDGALYASAPDRISGLVEVRGLGILRSSARSLVRIALLVDCVRQAPERLPAPAFDTLAEVCLPCLALDVRPASAAVHLSLAMDRL